MVNVFKAGPIYPMGQDGLFLKSPHPPYYPEKVHICRQLLCLNSVIPPIALYSTCAEKGHEKVFGGLLFVGEEEVGDLWGLFTLSLCSGPFVYIVARYDTWVEYFS